MWARKAFDGLFITLVMACMLVPLALTNNEEKARSDIDNRELAEVPKLDDVNFTSELECYLQDRIGLRNQMVNTYQILNDALFNELSHPIYMYGKDGYIMQNAGANRTYSVFHDRFVDAVAELQEYCESRGTRFYFVFNPEKNSVYRQYNPAGLNYDDSWVDTLLANMDERGIHYVDNRELLTTASKQSQVYNKLYDANHWNDLGCFLATNNVLDRIHEDIPAIGAVPLERFAVGTDLATQLPASEFPIQEEVPAFSLKQPPVDQSADFASELRVDAHYAHTHHYVNVNAGARELPRALIFQGSYYNSRPQFFVSALSEDFGVHNYQNVLDLDYYFNVVQPDVVIFEAAEYTLNDTYFSSTAMEELDLYPAVLNRDAPDSYDEQLATWMDGASQIVEPPLALVHTKRAVDSVTLSRHFLDTRYAYLVADDRVIDLKPDNNGLLTADIPHDMLTDNEEVMLLIEDIDGLRWYGTPTVRILSEMIVDLIRTDSASIDDSVITFSTSEKDNEFDHVAIQLLDDSWNVCQDGIFDTDERGLHEGSYIHELESGTYVIRLKANSSKLDECVAQTVHLTQGSVYHWSFYLQSLDEKECRVQGFQLTGLDG